MDPTQQFISEIDAFLKRTGMTPTVFGREALKDPNFVGDLKKKGRQPTLGVVGACKSSSARMRPRHE
ncbi:hypothetical protein SAMN05444171_8086 [Bradyrhizobium lablabi]|uniref:Uncharacterized protein n=1 Tax=Bradyrhizobium lablabi TaxID=722472 RepID=A0A1H5LQN1_9BRAD|nr:hypothetical protein SAMN05444171_8086 [Bradyrhizobium lablabi]